MPTTGMSGTRSASASASASAESKILKYVFLRSTRDADKTTLKPMPKQWRKDDFSGNAEEVQTTWRVMNPNAKMIAQKPIGTVFAVEGLTMKSGFYRVKEGAEMFPVTGPDVSATPEDIIDLYKQYLSMRGLSKESIEAEEKPKPKVETLLDKLKNDPLMKPPTIHDDGFWVEEHVWYTILRNSIKGLSTMLTGPTGCGKTELIRLIAVKIKKHLAIHDMGAMHDPTGSLLGVHRLNKDGVSEFDYASFVKDIQKPGFVLLDEISRAPFGTNNILFPVLDGRKELPIGLADSKHERKIDVNPDCVFFATANIGSQYSGTMQIDRALMDRFMMIELNYPPQDVEVSLLTKKTDCSFEAAAMIAKFAFDIRNLADEGSLSTAVSTRHTIEAAMLVADGFDVKQACETIFMNLYEGSRTVGERSTVYTMIMGK